MKNDVLVFILFSKRCFKKNKLFGITEEEKPPKDPAMKSGII